jgi:hypothetical protein
VSEGSRYRFGPLERRGLIAGWRGGQISSVAGGLVLAVVALRHPDVPGVLVALGCVAGALAIACWPIAGRTAEEWLPSVVRFGISRDRRWRSSVPSLGRRHPAQTPDTDVRAGSYRGLSLLVASAPPTVASQGIGVVFDRLTASYTAVLALRGHGFALLSADEKERRVSGWSSVLSSLARQPSVIHRVQWVASALPDDGRAVRGYLTERSTLAEDTEARRSYGRLLAMAGADLCRHQVHLAVSIRGRRGGWRGQPGGGTRQACAVLWREVAALRRLLSDTDVALADALSPSDLAALFRSATENEPGHEGRPVSTDWPWPLATEARWDCLRADGTWHATYWIAEWPRIDVGPEFLAPLLLGGLRRRVSVVMEPLSPSLATRKVQQARTADAADRELRRRGGFLPTARRAKETELVERREAELAEGHASFRFSGYVTVSATGPEELQELCEATEQAAGQARLELRRLYGDQERAFSCSLPVGRGLD